MTQPSARSLWRGAALALALIAGAAAVRLIWFRRSAAAPTPTPEWANRLRPGARRPNILLVVYDARRRDDLSLGRFGNRRGDTPFLQAFSRDALFFEDAVAPGCWTIPVHAAIFSGLSVCQLGIDLYNAGVRGFGRQFLSLAEILAVAGYRTVAYADHPHFYAENREASLIRGFQQFSVVSDFKRYGTHTNVGTNGRVELRYPFEGMPPMTPAELDEAMRRFNLGELAPDDDAVDHDPVHDVDFPKLAELFKRSRYFEQRYGLEFDRHVFPAGGDPRPFFLFLNLHMCLIAEPDPGLVHRFFLETLMLNARRRGTRLEPEAAQLGVAASLARNFERLGFSRGAFANALQFVKQAFDNRFYDASFEAVWRYLERRGLARDTVVVVTSDHGMSLGEHGEPLFLHDGARPYEYLTRVPLVIRFPQARGLTPLHGLRSEKVSLQDLFPTLVELALGPRVFQRDLPVMGRSLLERVERDDFDPVLLTEASLLPTPSHDWPDVAAYAKAVYRGDFKLIAAPASYRTGGALWPTAVRLGEAWAFTTPRPPYVRMKRPLTLLYDLARDPHELRNLAEARPEVVEQLRGLVAPDAWACQPLGPASQPPRFSDEARDTLRALGYVE